MMIWLVALQLKPEVYCSLVFRKSSLYLETANAITSKLNRYFTNIFFFFVRQGGRCGCANSLLLFLIHYLITDFSTCFSTSFCKINSLQKSASSSIRSHINSVNFISSAVRPILSQYFYSLNEAIFRNFN